MSRVPLASSRDDAILVFREALAQSGVEREGGSHFVPSKDAKWPVLARVNK